MLHYVSGDILLSRAQALAHGIAPNDNFGQGLALSLREQWPAMYKDFRHYCHTRHPEPGELWAWAGADGRMILSLFTQESAYGQGEKPGRATTGHVNHALKGLARFLTEESIDSVALPRLATGVGGLQWDEVKPLIENHLGSLDLKVYVYETFHPGQGAEEPGV